MKEQVVTRFAPSPTGFMHVGGVRTALYAYLWARKNNGKFILRIEDTDKVREQEGSIQHIVESLEWLGLTWDEGPIKQSDRLEIYKKYALKLIEKGLAYPDPYTKEELDEFRKQADLEKRPFLYRNHRPANFEKWDGTKPLRFKTPEIKSYKWKDVVYGELSAGEEALDDFILIKSDGYPTYNFAHIVDDKEMGVTHIMRSQEFIASVPKFLSLYEALEIEPPVLVTLPPIMAPDGKKKLSKRDGAKDILDYKREGYLPDALVNFLAFLGWNPGDEREIFNLRELVQEFQLERIGHSGAQLNDEKLDWLNKQHIRRLPEEILKEKIFEYLPKELKLDALVPMVGERISKWSDIAALIDNEGWGFFASLPVYDKNKLIFKNSSFDEVTENIKTSIGELERINENEWTQEKIKEVLMVLAEKASSKGALLHPIRFALSGLDRSPDPFAIAYVLGKNETISRLQKALA